MLLAKSNCLPNAKMSLEEEQCFYAISYLIAHLCLYRNETLVNFYLQSTTKHPREFELPIDQHVTDKISLINHSPHVELRKTKIIADKLINNLMDEKPSTLPISDSNGSHTSACAIKKSYEDIFLTKQILVKLACSISDLAENEYGPYHVKYKVIDRLVRLCTKLTEIDVDLLLHPIIQCLHSKFYLAIFDTVNLRQPIFDPKQSFFIRECFNFIDQHGYKQQTKIAEKLCKQMLENTKDIFAKHLPIVVESDEISEKADIYANKKSKEKGARMQALSHHIKLLNYFSLTPSTRKEFISQTIIDDILCILNTESLIESVHQHSQLFHVDVGVIAWSLTLLYNLMFDKDLFKKLKEKNTLRICEQLHTAKDDTIHFTSQNLITLLNQEEVDEIQDPHRFTRGYLYYIKNTLGQPNQTFHGIQLESTLKTFETISQNENIQEEIVNDEQGIQLLAECVCDPKLNEKTVQQPAMRIIFTISFVGEHAIEKIKEIDQLMENIVKATTSTEISKERAANGIMWNIENEQKFIEKTIKEENKKKEVKPQLIRPSTPPPLLQAKISKDITKLEDAYKYIPGDYQGWDNLLSQPSKSKPAPKEPNKPEIFDLMISYCHAQRDICHRLYDCLVNDQFHVWIDKENMYGSVLESMAEAIESSDVILMCMSTKYKESNACKLEAKYAWKRKKKTIPIKVEEKYDPIGWLGILCSDDSYIDFMKLGFDKAYKELLKEIRMIQNSDRK
ncbi:unnamed protein product [Rotaria sp. Silwood2]|nr:unnamed protein product [Rotaria sp. Silwood2]